MDDQQRDELNDVPADPAEELLPLEAEALSAESEGVSAADDFAGDAPSLEIAFSQPEGSEDLLAQEIERLKTVQPLETDLRLDASTGGVPLTPQESVFGKAPSPGRLNVGPQPHAFKNPIAYEPQPSFETPEDDSSAIAHAILRRGDDVGKTRDLVYRYGDPENEPRVQLLSEEHRAPTPIGPSPDGASANEGSTRQESAGQPGRGQTLPRVLVTVSMANARVVFQECIERASQTLGAKFHSACQSTVNDYARDRRAAERAANRGSH